MRVAHRHNVRGEARARAGFARGRVGDDRSLSAAQAKTGMTKPRNFHRINRLGLARRSAEPARSAASELKVPELETASALGRQPVASPGHWSDHPPMAIRPDKPTWPWSRRL